MSQFLTIPVVCALLIGVAHPAQADDAAAKAKEKQAVKLLTLSGGKKSTELMINRISARLPQAELLLFLKRTDIDELMALIAVVYTERFTANELQQMIDHYETPEGKTFAKKRPAAIAMAIKVGQEYTRKRLTNQPVKLPTPGPGKNDPLRNAVALMIASGEAAATEESIDTMLEAAKRTNPARAEQLRELLDPEDMNMLAAKAAADIFTVKEMQSMIEFLKTPTGAKWAKLMPTIMRESGKISEKYFTEKLRR